MRGEFHDLGRPARTMWQASLDLLAEAARRRDPAMHERGFRLWVQASKSRAPGVPFEMTTYLAAWMPTDPAEGCGRP